MALLAIHQLVQPYDLLLILLIPLALIIAAWMNAEFKDGVFHPHFQVINRLSRMPGQQWYYVPLLLRCLAMAALVLALARPQGLGQKVSTQVQGQDVMLVLDVSESMNADDLQPSRLAVAKQVLEHFISQRPHDRIGLVLLAGAAFTAVPLTQDYGSLLQTLQEVQTRMIRLEGTALGDGILVAVNRLLESKVPGEKPDARRGFIILATDGNNTSGFDPVQSARIAADKGLRVYTVSLGGSVPALRKTGSKSGEDTPLRDDAGRAVYWRLPDLETLNQLAAVGHGRFFRAEDQNQLTAVFNQIDQKEKPKITITRQTVFTEYYFWPLGLALMLLGLERLLLRTRFLEFG